MWHRCSTQIQDKIKSAFLGHTCRMDCLDERVRRSYVSDHRDRSCQTCSISPAREETPSGWRWARAFLAEFWWCARPFWDWRKVIQRRLAHWWNCECKWRSRSLSDPFPQGYNRHRSVCRESAPHLTQVRVTKMKVNIKVITYAARCVDNCLNVEDIDRIITCQTCPLPLLIPIIHDFHLAAFYVDRISIGQIFLGIGVQHFL